jgi:hypothetical protein
MIIQMHYNKIFTKYNRRGKVLLVPRQNLIKGSCFTLSVNEVQQGEGGDDKRVGDFAAADHCGNVR